MRAQPSLRRSRLLLPVCVMLAAALAFTYPAISPAAAADARLERAEEQRRSAQAQLAAAYDRLNAAQAEVEQAEANLAELQARERSFQESAQSASGALAHRIRQGYKLGSPDPSLALFSMQSPEEALQHARLLGLLAHRSRADFETASAAQIRTRVAAEEVAAAAIELRTRRDTLDSARSEAAALLARAESEEQQVRSQIAAEQAARERAAREAAERERSRAVASRPSRSAPSGGSAVAAAPVTGGVACPVGSPRSYSDTWGAPRSGGRSHKGTDIMAPRGTPIYAYENGTITRLTNSRLGGISLYMRGDSGNTYYYTHLQGYVSGIAAGQRVSVGQHVAFNGDTGNARGIPHLHFEVMPGGGGNVNPYPYVKRACG